MFNHTFYTYQLKKHYFNGTGYRIVNESHFSKFIMSCMEYDETVFYLFTFYLVMFSSHICCEYIHTYDTIDLTMSLFLLSLRIRKW